MQLPQSIIPSTDVMQLTLTRNITTAQVVKTSVTVNNNSPIQDYVHPDDHTEPSYEGSSLQASSPIWASEASHARMCEK